MPGLYLQKLTTAEPDLKQLEVAIASVKAVLNDGDDVPYFEGICDLEGRLVEADIPETQEDLRRKKNEFNVKRTYKNRTDAA